MATTKAKSKQEVDEMTPEQRAWDSLDYSYGKKKEASDKSYDNAISQQDAALLRRGMQRSSYGMNTLAGLQNQKVNAANDIDSEKIAAYEAQRYQLDRDAIEDAFRDKQFDEQVRQYNESLGFQKEEAARSQGNWEKEYDANRADTAWSQAFQQNQFDYQKQQDAQSQANWEAQFGYQKEQDAQSQANWEKQFGYQQQQDAQSQANWEAQFGYQKEQDAQSQANWETQFGYQKEQDAQSQANWETQLAYQKEQDALAQENWKEQFGYQKEQDAQTQANWEKQFGYQQEQDAQTQANWEKTFGYQQERDAISDAFAEKQFEFQQQQWETQKEQWREEFDFNKMSTEQQLYYNYIMQALEAGGDVSDEMLAKAGISRADFNAMKRKAEETVGGGGGYYGNKNGNDTGNPGNNDDNGSSYDDLMEELDQNPATAKAATTSNLKPISKGVYKGTSTTSKGKKANDVYIMEQDNYASDDEKLTKRSGNDKKQVTWKNSYIK